MLPTLLQPVLGVPLTSLERFAPSSLEIAEHMLVDTLMPTAHTMVSGRGAEFETDKGRFIDFQSRTVNCVLGQNDPWVKLSQIAYLLSDRPSFHSTRFGSELYYTLPVRLKQLGIAGIDDPAFCHH